MNRDEIVALDKARVWHPFTAMRVYLDEVDPLVVVRAEGSRLWDADGRAYLDGNSSWWTASLGHRHPRLVAAVERQLRAVDHVAFAGIAHEGAAALAAELVDVAPAGLNRVFYTDNGSTSLEAAIKMAVQATGRTRFVALDGAYHGDTVGAASLGGVETFRRPFGGILFDCVHAAFPGAHVPVDDSVAAVVVEPVLQGAAGMRIYAPSHLRELRDACDRAGALLVFDEVFTGYGRTGPMWAAQHAGVSPDILCLGKAFAQFMPMGAVLVADRVFDRFLADRETAFHYGHTFCGNPLGAAVAREVLAIYKEEDVLGQVAAKTPRIARAMKRLGGRAIGMVGAVDLGSESSARESLEESGTLGTLGWRFYAEARKRGAYLRPLGDTVYVCPPLTIAEKDLDELLAIFEECVGAVSGRRPSP
ncbi:MAG TPA: aminotransferase class III-fold pyridoxal phosphate-dependent enzyme [Polyangiaceae bacterium]